MRPPLSWIGPQDLQPPSAPPKPGRARYLDLLVEALLLQAKREKDWRDQERVPAGSPEGGQFGSGTGDSSGGTSSQEHKDRIQSVADAVAKSEGVDPKLISIVDEGRQFTVNGKEMTSGGTFFPDTGTIKLYSNTLANLESARFVAIHEVQHLKWHTAWEKRNADYKALQEEAAKIKPKPESEHTWERQGGMEAIMRPDGTLREGYAEKYPA